MRPSCDVQCKESKYVERPLAMHQLRWVIRWYGMCEWTSLSICPILLYYRLPSHRMFFLRSF